MVCFFLVIKEKPLKQKVMTEKIWAFLENNLNFSKLQQVMVRLLEYCAKHARAKLVLKILFEYVIIYTDIAIHTYFSTYTFQLTILQYFCCCLMLVLWTSLGPKRIPALQRLWKDFFPRRQQATLSIRYSRCRTVVFQPAGFLLLGQQVWLRQD